MLTGGLVWWYVGRFFLNEWGAKTPGGTFAINGTFLAEVVLTAIVSTLFIVAGEMEHRPLRGWGCALLAVVVQALAMTFGIYAVY